MVFLPWKAFATSAPISPVFVATITVSIFFFSTYALILFKKQFCVL